MQVVKQQWAIVLEEEDDMVHTAENGYECSDPGCICHDAEECDSSAFALFLPSTEQAMRELRQGR